MNKKQKNLSGLKSTTALLVLLLGLIAPSIAMATDKKDILVGLKTLPMLDNPLKEPIVMAIIYDPSNAASRADADMIKSALDEGMQSPEGLKIVGVLVPVSEISKIGQAKLAFITNGLRDHFVAIASAASAVGALTMSTDIECVKANQCVLGIVSAPSVEIYYSRAASEASKIDFDPAFTMLVKKV